MSDNISTTSGNRQFKNKVVIWIRKRWTPGEENLLKVTD
jgi:hypothetical protein